MPEDRSLDEFFETDGESDGTADADSTIGGDEACTEGGDEAPTHPDEKTDVRDSVAVEPATATFDWSPDGAECARCGSIVDRRWIDDGEYACANCKEW